MRQIIIDIRENLSKKGTRYKVLVATLSFFIISLIVLTLIVYLNNKKELYADILSDNSTLSSGLVLYFPFNRNKSYGENGYFIYDFSGNKNHGIAHNASWNSETGIYNDGVFEFNGIDSYIKVKDSRTLSPKTYNNHFSVAFFVKFDNTSFIGQGYNNSYINYLGKANPGNYEWEFRQYNSSNPDNRPNRLSFYAFNKKGGLGAGGYVQENITEGEWIFIAGVIDGDEIRIYKNGILKNTQSLSENRIKIRNANSDLYIGTADKGAYFKGSIDELRIYNRSLNNSEILAIYMSGR